MPGLDHVPLTAVPVFPPAGPGPDSMTAEPEPMTRALVVVRPYLRLRKMVLYGTFWITMLAAWTGGPPDTIRQRWRRAPNVQAWVAWPGAVIFRLDVRHAPVLARLGSPPTPVPS